MHEALVLEIEETRARRGEMREEEESLPDDAGTRRQKLLEESTISMHASYDSRTLCVHELLESPGKKAARQTDPTRPPKLPEDPEER